MGNIVSYNQFFRILISAFALTATYLAITLELGNANVLAWLISVCFLICLWFEYRHSRHLFFSLPPTYFCLFMFVNIFLSGLVYYWFDRAEIVQFLVPDEFIIMGLWYTFVAIQILWIGFYILPSRPYRTFSKLYIQTIPLWVVHLLMLIFVVSFIIAVNNNMFGYVADNEKNEWLGTVKYGISCGLVAVIALTIYHNDSQKLRFYLYSVIAANMAVGLLFGSKSTAITPILLYILTNYLLGRKVRMRVIVIFFLAIAMAYAVIEPFRIYFDTIGATGANFSVSSLISFFFAAKDATEGTETAYLQSFIRRMDYATPVGKTLEFAHLTGTYLNDQWQHLAMSPLYGLIPRFIWDTKPLADFGLWASVHIFDLPRNTHTGITPQGFAYLVLRLPGIILFFLLYGLIQRIAFNSFYLARGLLPVYIYFYFFILFPPFPIWTAISAYIQALVIVIPILFISAVFRKKKIQPFSIKE